MLGRVPSGSRRRRPRTRGHRAGTFASSSRRSPGEGPGPTVTGVAVSEHPGERDGGHGVWRREAQPRGRGGNFPPDDAVHEGAARAPGGKPHAHRAVLVRGDLGPHAGSALEEGLGVKPLRSRERPSPAQGHPVSTLGELPLARGGTRGPPAPGPRGDFPCPLPAEGVLRNTPSRAWVSPTTGGRRWPWSGAASLGTAALHNQVMGLPVRASGGGQRWQGSP